jgi:hypothetical protein
MSEIDDLHGIASFLVATAACVREVSSRQAKRDVTMPPAAAVGKSRHQRISGDGPL